MRKWLADNVSKEAAEATRIIYGGSGGFHKQCVAGSCAAVFSVAGWCWVAGSSAAATARSEDWQCMRLPAPAPSL